MAIVFGSLVATFLCFGHHWFISPTRLVYAPAAAPALLRISLSIMAIAVLVSGVQDAAAALRLSKLAAAKSSRPPEQSTWSHELQPPAARRHQR
jgi:hypothetical protein